MKIEKITIETEYIKLDQLLKWSGIVGSGTDAKYIISEGLVEVNDQVIVQRGKKIFPRDKVFVNLDNEIKLIVEK